MGVEVDWDLVGLELVISAIAIGYIILLINFVLRKIPGMLLRLITSSKLSPEKPPHLLGMPSGGTTLIQTL